MAIIQPCLPAARTQGLDALQFGAPLQTPWIPPVVSKAPQPAPAPLQNALFPGTVERFNNPFGDTLWAQILLSRAAFARSDTYMRDVAAAVWGTAYQLNFTAPSPALPPGWSVIQLAGFDLVVVAGTTNREQWFSFLSTAPLGPVGDSPFAVFQSFGQGAAAVVDGMKALHLDETKAILFLGHSYGGAVATILGGLALWKNRTRSVTVRTFGEPKPGDALLRQLVNGSADKCRYMTAGDVITSSPPEFRTYNLSLVPVVSAIIAKCRLFKHSGAPFTIAPTGQLQRQAAYFVGTGDETDLYAAVLAGSAEPLITQHSGSTYSALIRRSFGNLHDGIDSGFADPDGLTRASVRLAAAGL